MRKIIDVVGAVIFNERNEVLCALRSEKMSSPGVWEFPGGKVEQGETHQEALAREIIEELSCHISVNHFIEDTSIEKEESIIRLSTYYCQLDSGSPIPKEHEELIWLPIEELTKLRWAPADLPTVRKLMKTCG